MLIFQLLGLILPVSFFIWLYGDLIKQCNNGNDNLTVPTWQIIMTGISIFVLGFTLGTLI